MSKELVIGSNRHETKVAILEEDQLVEIYFQRGNEYSLAGSIHKGRVTRVLPGMQSAFVDLGLERDTFLYVSDFFEEHDDIDTVGDEPAVKSERRDNRRGGERGPVERSADRHQTERLDGERDRTPSEQATERPFDEAYPEPTKIRAIDGGPAFLESEEEGESLGGLPESSALTAAGERAEGGPNRGDRGGDRGNRRGRRRRPRGRGFPDNKYAQPSSLSSSSPASGESAGSRPGSDSSQPNRIPAERLPGEKIGGDRPSFERAYADRSSLERIATPERFGGDRARREEPAAFEATDPADVIILPGESLAKYRRAAQPVQAAGIVPPVSAEPLPMELTSEPAARPVTDQFTGELHPIAAELGNESSLPKPSAVDEIAEDNPAAEHQAIQDEAEELELTDRIFSHHETEEVAEQEKFDGLETERVEPPAVPVAPEQLPEADPAVEGRHEEFALPFESTGTVELVSPIVIDAEPLTTFEASAPFGLSSEGEAEEGDEDEPASEEPEELSGEARVSDPPMTANLRDTSGRSMHRGSRRSRRRRGGNRAGSPIGSSADLTANTPVPALGLAAGTAAALDPVEVRREAVEVRAEARPERAERIMPSISDLLKAGQEIIVQIAKEPLGQKGARITSHIALPGRYVVFMPSVTHLGVSRKVASDEERQRLKQILQKHRVGTTGGFIVRTAGEGVPEEEIAADMNFLYNLWLDIRQKAEKKPAPLLLHYDLDIVQRILRDHVTDDFKAIWVDNEDLYESILIFMQRFQPTLVSRVKMYTREAPIFDAFNITGELEKALRPKVWLKSGGYIVINQTEALVAIDINTGKYVGKSNRLEDTIVKTNTEAVKEIVRQIRLRDLGGIIVVDFIDMDERKNRQKVMAALEEAMESDKAPYKILQFNDFGLVAITRKRVKQSLERTLCAPCPYCEGAGYVKSVQTTIGEILVEAQKIARAIDGKDVVLRVHPEVAKVLKASNNKFLEEIEEILKRPVLVAGDATLHTEKFDLA